MKNNGYMDRAERARDPRFARVLGKLGYERRDMVAAAPTVADGIAAARDEYERALGKRPFNGWNVATLREKIAAAKAGA
jgi:hypothetical protein